MSDSSAILFLANAIKGGAGAKDAQGGHVESLTEAVMGITAALTQMAGAMQAIADAMTIESSRAH